MSKLYAQSESDTMTLSEDGRVFVNHQEYFPASELPPEVETFVVGDFVRVVGQGEYDYDFTGEHGKVIYVTERKAGVGVEFAQYDVSRHSLNGATRQGHGYWFEPLYLAKEE